MTFESAAVLVLLTVLLVLEFVILSLALSARPGGKKEPLADHPHQGTIRSRHNLNGHEMIVGECRQCQMHMIVDTDA